MSSATSTEEAKLDATTQRARGEDVGLRPWQFFLLAGMLSATGVVLIVGGQSPASIIVLSLTVVAGSLVALGAYRAFAPLVVPEAFEAPPLIVGRTRAALEREKTLVLRSIKELEFDFAMGKMAKGDFEEMSGRLRARAIGLMRQLDKSGGYRQEIEREIQNRLGAALLRSPSSGGQAGLSTEAPPGAKVDATGATGACECGIVNDPDARFCKGCGSRLVAA